MRADHWYELSIMLLLVFLLAAVLVYLWWQSEPTRMIARGPNATVGIRTSATISSTDAWAAAHRTARPAINRGTLLGLLGVAIGLFAALNADIDARNSIARVTVAVSLLGYTVFLVVAALKGHRAAVQIQRSDETGEA